MATKEERETIAGLYADNDVLRAEVERLQGDVSHYRYRAQNAEVEVERLTEALRHIESVASWDVVVFVRKTLGNAKE